jgi:hypothetical protein
MSPSDTRLSYSYSYGYSYNSSHIRHEPSRLRAVLIRRGDQTAGPLLIGHTASRDRH